MRKNGFRTGYCAAILAAALLLLSACNNSIITEGKEAESVSGRAQRNVKLTPLDVPGDFPSLPEAFDFIAEDTDTVYDITISADISSDPIDVTDAAFAGKTITIVNGGGDTITLNSAGALFTVGSTGSPVTLTIDGTITLAGLPNNNSPLVAVNSGGIFNLTGDTIITGNNDSTTNGGGVAVTEGVFSMSGNSLITANQARVGGGGVYATRGAAVSLGDSATISSNSSGGNGGGLMIDMSSTLTMGGGTVSYNTSTGSLGGGVYIGDSCTFNMTDGAITANHIDSQRVKTAGGGVAVHFGGAFNMTGGVISENYITADSGHADGIFGGGVYVSIHNSTFVLSGGVISGNAVYHANPDATSLMAGGGGVCIDSGYYSDNLLFDKQTAPAGQALIYGYGTSADNNKVFLGYVPPLPIPSPAPVRKYGSAVLVLYSTFSSGKPNTVVRIVESDVINTDVFSVLYNDNNRWTFSGTWPALNPAY